jgi:hypothetical protein
MRLSSLESRVLEDLKTLRLSMLHLRMQALTDRAHFTKVMQVQERIVQFVVGRQEQITLELAI